MASQRSYATRSSTIATSATSSASRRHRACAPQRLGERGDGGGLLDQLAFAQRGVGRDQLRAPTQLRAPRLELAATASSPAWTTEPASAPRTARHEGLLHGRLVGEQHLALVGEVAEERALGEVGARGDLRRRRLVIAALGEQVERGGRQAFTGVGFPAGDTT